MRAKGHKIKMVEPGSIAEQLELEAGDWLVAMDGHKVEDVFDYQYYLNSEAVVLNVVKADGEEWELDIQHGYEDLGLVFENGLMSDYRSCRNKCIFCFIDQMPPGMRETLYFKDDDSRLSFLQGNYITMTNMDEKDMERILRFHLSPVNISVHATNPKLRCKMLNNRFAGDILEKIHGLCQAHTPMNGQVVLCKGVNDGKELERTIEDLYGCLPWMESLSIVPVGLSKFRDGLYPLEPIGKEDAGQVVDLVERWQKKAWSQHGCHFVHASDEFYILAERPLPEEGRYDGYVQLENGVGMVRLLESEVEAELACLPGDGKKDALSIATGWLAYPFIQKLVEKMQKKYPGRKVAIYPITNYYFGEQITVAGLITGKDLVEQLRGKQLGGRLLLAQSMFRSGEEVLLDDVTRGGLEKALQVPVNIVKSSGHDFVQALLHPTGAGRAEYAGYELKEIKHE